MMERARRDDDEDERPGMVIGPTSGGPDIDVTGTGPGRPVSPHSDERILAEVRARIAASSLAAYALDVAVDDRVVTLAGTVPDEASAHAAVQIGESVAGVRRVRSAVTVRRGRAA